MTVEEIVAGVQTRGGELRLDDGRVTFRGPEGLLTPNLLDSLTRHKAEVARLLAGQMDELDEAAGLGTLRLSQFAGSRRVVRLWSEVLGETVYLAADNANVSVLPPEAVVYFARELGTLPGLSAEGLRLLHQVKTVFGGAIAPEEDDRERDEE